MQNNPENQAIRLTQTVQKGGCAAKVAAHELRSILAQVKFPPKGSDVLVDGGLMDDAAIIAVTPNRALVQTLDFFTPIVDTPRVFGQIASANALSDVYAMGGTPSSCMAILAFPLTKFSQATIAEVLQGASDKIAEANASLVGGHSIDDDTLKFGLSVTGYVHPERIWTNAKAKTGDKLILTKSLGTGTATAALKRQEVTENEIAEQIHSMCALNNLNIHHIPELAKYVNAATDITGFGFAGHAIQMGRASSKTLRVEFNKIPLFEKTDFFLEKGFLTKAHRTNREYTQNELVSSGLSELQKLSLFDPQTSGGLLLSVSSEKADELLREIKKTHPKSSVIGDVIDSSGSSRLEVH